MVLPLAGPIAPRQSLPNNIVAPLASPVLVVGALITPVASGLVTVSVQVGCTGLATADTLGLEVFTVAGATSITGGTERDGVYYITSLAGPGLITINGGGAPVLQQTAFNVTGQIVVGNQGAAPVVELVLNLTKGTQYAIGCDLFDAGGTTIGFSSFTFAAYELPNLYG